MLSKKLIDTIKKCEELVKLKNSYEKAKHELTSQSDILYQGINISTPIEKINAAIQTAKKDLTHDNPLISIITVTKNSAEHLERALKSILSLDYKNIEIIIQDGNSTDNTKEVVEKLGLINNFYVEKDKATIDGLLRAVTRAKGDIIGVCWSDDELLPHAAAWAASILKDKSIDIVYGDQLTVDTLRGRTTLTTGNDWDLERFFTHEFYPPFSSSFFRRKTLISLIGKLVEFDHDEYEFWLWLGLFNIKYKPGLVSKFYVHKNTRWIKPGHAKDMLQGKRRAAQRFAEYPPLKNKFKDLLENAEIGLQIWSCLHEISCCQSIPTALPYMESLQGKFKGNPLVEDSIKLLIAESLRNDSYLLDRIINAYRPFNKLLETSISTPASFEEAHKQPLENKYPLNPFLPNSTGVKPPISRIAILNPYLQGGHTQTAEIESAKRIVQAAEKLGIETRILASSDEIDQFDPDFVLPITYQEPKLSAYPTYGLLTMPVSWVQDIPRFVRNILSYDGYLTVSSSVHHWIKTLCALHNKELHVANAAFSIQSTQYFPCDFKNPKAVYVGTNWDGSRHQDLFHELSDGEFLQCYGPEKSWKNYPKSLYGGEIPFDGVSMLSTYNRHNVGLCFNHPTFDREGIPSSRTFEIAAASALALCANNSYTRSIFGDSVLYLDTEVSTHELAEQIKEALLWIRYNPIVAEKMAREAHEIFNNQISMDIFLKNIIEMHMNVLKSKGHFLPDNSSMMPRVTYLINTHASDNPLEIQKSIQSILNQTYKNIDIIVICTPKIKVSLENMILNTSVYYVDSELSNINKIIYEKLRDNGTQLFGFLRTSDLLFKNHVMFLVNATFELLTKFTKTLGVYSASLAYSKQHYLDDNMSDDFFILNQTKTKVDFLPIKNEKMPKQDDKNLNACLLSLNSFNFESFSKVDFSKQNVSDMLKHQIQKDNHWIYLPEITAATAVI